MKIGLARHYKLPHRRYTLASKHQFLDWIDWYNTTPPPPMIPQGTNEIWDICYTSPLPRALHTAKTLIPTHIPLVLDSRLVEVPFSAPRHAYIPHLPLMFWQVLSRFGWWLKMDYQVESQQETLNRIRAFIDEIIQKHPHQRVLIVTHGFLMQYMRGVFRQHGFTGTIPIHPRFGYTYLLKK